jgi:hypothetical protein
MSKGYVYVLSNPAMPGLVKIGSTQGDPELRAKLICTTGVPASFCVEFKGRVSNAAALERRVHNYLSDCRYSSRREFFKASADTAVFALAACYYEMKDEGLLQ